MRALSRKSANRKSLLRNLATSLVLYEKIETTEAKAKEVRSEVEHLISLAKKNDLSARRKMNSYFFDENATKKVIEVLLPRYDKINSGFIKSYRKGHRLGDGAMMMILELKKVETNIEKSVESQDGKANKVEKNQTSPSKKTGTTGKKAGRVAQKNGGI